MGIDQNEHQRQRKVDKPKRTLHPYFALEHRIIDSIAYADLGFSARALLDLLGRQLSRDNNGHLQATFSWCKRYGFGSEHTLQNAIDELIKHGFLYRTRSHGANRVWAKYALTWLPIRKSEGLYLDLFKPLAYLDWQPPQHMTNKKSSRQKVQASASRKCRFTPEHPAESAGKPTAESAEYETCCHGNDVSNGVCNVKGFTTSTTTVRLSTHQSDQKKLSAWIPVYLSELATRGLSDRQCFQIPQGVTHQ